MHEAHFFIDQPALGAIGDFHAHDGAHIDFGIDLQRAAQLLDGLFHNIKPQAGTLGALRTAVEHLAHLIDMYGRNAYAIVDNFYGGLMEFAGDNYPHKRLGFGGVIVLHTVADYVVEDASYYCLREVIVGYTLPDKLAKALHLNSLRAYFSGQNLYFHSAAGYRGINTEARFTSGPYNTPSVDGYQRGGFPMPRTILFGIDINF